MGTYKRKLSRGERWYYRGQYLNVKYCSQAIYLTKQEAQRAERDRLKEIDQEARCPTKDIYLKVLIEARLDLIKAKMSKGYYDDNRQFLKVLLEELGNVLVSTIGKRQVSQVILDEAVRFMEEGTSNHRTNAMIRCFKALFNYGIDNYELSIKNPCQRMKLYPIEIKLKKIPTDEEMAEVIAKLNMEQKELFDFVDESACRINEAIRLDWKDVDEKQVVLYTRKSRNSNLTPRIIPRPSCLAGEGTGRVFSHWTANPRFLEDIADGWGFHNLRHRRASIWANGGMSILEIMARLGHSNLDTTMRYLQLLGFTRFSPKTALGL